jgi:NADPH2:quinone reductase
MRAWQVHQHGDPTTALRLVDCPEPTPGPGEVRVRVHAAALGMPDAFMCQATYALTPPLPFVPGQEVCGTIDALGPDVAHDGPLRVGMRVMGVTLFTDGRGGFAESTILRVGGTFPVPEAMTDTDAAGFRIGYSTAWIGLVRRGRLQPGETLLVLGAAGGSGATALQVGAALGARVIAVAAGADKAAYLTALGADVVIDRTQVGSVRDAVSAATDGRGVDVIYDPVGGAPAEAVLRCLRSGGRILAVGFASGRWVEVSTVHAVRHNYSLVGVYAGGYTAEETNADQDALIALAAAGKLASVVHAVPFDELPTALVDVAQGRVVGKAVAVFS